MSVDPVPVPVRIVIDTTPVPMGETLVIVVVPSPPLAGPVTEIDVAAMYRDRGLPWSGGPSPVAMADVHGAGDRAHGHADVLPANVVRHEGDVPSDATEVTP